MLRDLGVCQFGLAHVDSPKGDLDLSSSITDASMTVAVNSQLYPQGTTELYPRLTDSAGAAISNSAHAYAECSNK